MPVVNYPLQCSSCRGAGQVKPACAFNVNSKAMMIECMGCQGRGTVDNKVYVNPHKESVLTDGSLTQSNSILPIQQIEELNFKSPSANEISEVFDTKEMEKVEKEIKKIKSKKTDHHSDNNDACR